MACMPLFSPDQAPDGHSKNLGLSRAYNRRPCVGTTRSSAGRLFAGPKEVERERQLRRDCAAKFILVLVRTWVRMQGAATQRKPLSTRCRSKAMRHAAREEHRRRTIYKHTDLLHAAAWRASQLASNFLCQSAQLACRVFISHKIHHGYRWDLRRKIDGRHRGSWTEWRRGSGLPIGCLAATTPGHQSISRPQ